MSEDVLASIQAIKKFGASVVFRKNICEINVTKDNIVDLGNVLLQVQNELSKISGRTWNPSRWEPRVVPHMAS